MKMLGVEFASLNVPLERRLQTLAVVYYLFLLLGSGLIGIFLVLYVTLFTTWSWLALIYLLWIFVIDKKTCETGGRRSKWLRNWSCWKYLKDYFPLKLVKTPDVALDAEKNYLFCCFPHGIFSTGTFSAFNTNAGGFNDLFPHHTVYLLNLGQLFKVPLLRELGLACGGCSVSADSIRYLLSSPRGGKVVAIMVGGAHEAFYSRPGHYSVLVKSRRGFVKLALKYGVPLVPVFSFGETDIYNQVDNPEGSVLRKVQEVMKKTTGFAPVIPKGRGIFQYTFGLLPFRKPITTVGRPIEVEKVVDPTQEQIDELHEKFVKELVKLFEENKHLHMKDSGKIKLEIE